MQFLIDFAASDPEFRQLLERAQQFPTVQGIVLDIDRWWLRAWACRQLSGGHGPDDSYFDADDHACRRHDDGAVVWPEPLKLSDVEGWLPFAWRNRRIRPGFSDERSPLSAKVCIRPLGSTGERHPTLDDLYIEGGRLQVTIEARSRAKLSSNPRKPYSPLLGGVSIGVGAADYGTLGVVMNDGKGRHYAVTCSHVVPYANQVFQPSQRDYSPSNTIGRSILATPLTACPAGVSCNPWSGIAAHEIDASLIELSAAHMTALMEVLDLGPLSGVMPRSSITPLQALEVMGRTSKYKAMRVGGLAVWYSFQHGGNDYCFKNLFEVESPYGAAGVIKSGDSGGPVCSPDANGTAWAGLIVGRDAFKGYASYSETVNQWLAGNGYHLSVV